ncbi:PH domain-containing protein [Chryseobacterium sp.]|uniref:PH domain-containing protein n=1 Tax=Chryseobacterium sp. TaxID=1871047 RepID=UPI00261062C7|nr:PH domain-containing protein [Chryseobacterium sp.]
MDTLLGANALSDGGILCNKCLDKLSNINQESLYNLNKFSIQDIHDMLRTGKTEPVQPLIITEQNLPVLTTSEPQSISNEVFKRRKRKIKYELQKLNANLSAFTRGEIKELPYLIPEDEKIIAITDAQFINTLDAGVLVATSLRMISVSKSMFGSAKISDYPNETIQSVSFIADPRSPVVRLHLDERIVEFECYMDKEDAEKFYDIIKAIYNAPPAAAQKQIAEVNEKPAEDVFEQLEKLGKLRENGILTDAEFAEQKKKLLERLK